MKRGISIALVAVPALVIMTVLAPTGISAATRDVHALTITASSPTVFWLQGATVSPIYSPSLPAGYTLKHPPVCVGTGYSVTAPVGTYPTSCSGASDPNYSPITYKAGTLTVQREHLNITATSATVAYGAAKPVISPRYDPALPTGYVVKTAPVCTTNYVPGNEPGQYNSSCSGAKDPNFTVQNYFLGIVHVTKATPTLAYAGPAKAGYLKQVAFKATLTGNGGAGLSGQTLTFTLGKPSHTISCSGTTDSTGTASCTLKVTVVVGTEPMSIAFAGNTEYKAVSTLAAVTVN